MTLHERARRRVYSLAISTRACAERLAAIDNDAVNRAAHDLNVRRMQSEVEEWEYIYGRLDLDPSGIALGAVVDHCKSLGWDPESGTVLLDWIGLRASGGAE